MSWEEAWREGRTGWDAGESPPVLRELVAEGSLPSGLALVNGAGAGYDILTLAGPTRRVIGLDLATTAAERFRALRAERDISAQHAELTVDDFFTHEPIAPFDLIWDYTFLCAIEPAQREAWAERVDDLLAPGGELVTLIFPVDPGRDPDEGPPYPLTPDGVRELLAGRFEPTHLAPVDRSHPGREGKEWLGRWRRPPLRPTGRRVGG